MDKITFGHLRDYVRAVLFFEWDPIGVNDDAAAYDEYHSYADVVVSMLINGKSAKEVADYLFKVQEERITIGGPYSHSLGVAEKCVKAKKQLESLYP